MSTNSEPLNLRPVPSSSKSGSKPIPSPSILKPWEFDYQPSPDGKDINLLIMFHGLGDTKRPFFELGKQLKLPSTAVLSLQALDPVPFMDNPSFSWYNTFDPMFNPLPNPSPSKTLPPLLNLLSALCSKEIGWQPTDIHLFGWGQGGTMALELGLEVGKKGFPPLSNGQSGDSTSGGKRLGSMVSICGPLLSSPPFHTISQTPTTHFTRLNPSSAAHGKRQRETEKAFKDAAFLFGKGGGEGMLKGREEWEGVMKFWSGVLGREEGWRGGGEVFEVVR